MTCALNYTKAISIYKKNYAHSYHECVSPSRLPLSTKSISLYYYTCTCMKILKVALHHGLYFTSSDNPDAEEDIGSLPEQKRLVCVVSVN